MRASLTLTIRLGVVLAFLVSMPVLALPQVNRWVEENFLDLSYPSRLSAEPVRTPHAVAKNSPSLPSVEQPNEEMQKSAPRSDVIRTSAKELEDNHLAATTTESVARLSPTDSEFDNEIDNQRFHELQGRLQRLGVQYLVLEKWPSSGIHYRFHCRMAVPGSSAYARPFEASDVDPLRAMQTVLNDVETWCASHSTTTSSKLR